MADPEATDSDEIDKTDRHSLEWTDAARSFYNSLAIAEARHVPILYSDHYNIRFAGLERLHPFDSCKYANIVSELVKPREVIRATEDVDTDADVDAQSASAVEPALLARDQLVETLRELSREELLRVHTAAYLDSLSSSRTVAYITELFFVALIPNFLVQRTVLRPMRYASAGTVRAAALAVERGFAINLGAGFHHCCAYQGGGFCPVADITLAIRYLRDHVPSVRRVLIIDLDAHQGNGHARDKLDAADDHLHILDIYNKDIYPDDQLARTAIDMELRVRSGIGDADYLKTVRRGLGRAAELHRATAIDFVLYNAGTDILDGDPLGNMRVSGDGVLRRDELVFRFCLERGIPVCMVLSGGYQANNALVIANSIRNLFRVFDLKNRSRESGSSSSSSSTSLVST
eukprot:CAMPEP_0177661998 /NCGR_PEP_ID=MMETSP0447-20121125/19027_1 /TAXON_ID=0 /ORGANISM="Stygamoeba regulata, Strain BSH-02190019" /LENGTH=403 /DNA_ID=CAMNT_0019167477 /DNA_START=57 /DNA_END=1268 /DNA_ORIENTATION=+